MSCSEYCRDFWRNHSSPHLPEASERGGEQDIRRTEAKQGWFQLAPQKRSWLSFSCTVSHWLKGPLRGNSACRSRNLWIISKEFSLWTVRSRNKDGAHRTGEKKHPGRSKWSTDSIYYRCKNYTGTTCNKFMIFFEQ